MRTDCADVCPDVPHAHATGGFVDDPSTWFRPIRLADARLSRRDRWLVAGTDPTTVALSMPTGVAA